MLTHINTLTFNGLEIQRVDLQAQISSGLPNFIIVGLPDKAIAESKERVRAAVQSLGLQLPPKRIVINLAPADLLKEGSHFDLPIALGILSVMGIVPAAALNDYMVMGERPKTAWASSALRPAVPRPPGPDCKKSRQRRICNV